MCNYLFTSTKLFLLSKCPEKLNLQLVVAPPCCRCNRLLLTFFLCSAQPRHYKWIKLCLKEWNWQRAWSLFMFLEESFNFTMSGWKILQKWRKKNSFGATIPCRHAAAQFNQAVRKQPRAAASEISIGKLITASTLKHSNGLLKPTRQMQSKGSSQRSREKTRFGWRSGENAIELAISVFVAFNLHLHGASDSPSLSSRVWLGGSWMSTETRARKVLESTSRNLKIAKNNPCR